MNFRPSSITNVFKRNLYLPATLALLAAGVSTQIQAANLYNDASGASGTATSETGVNHSLQLINLTPANATSYTITGFTIAGNFTTTDEQYLFFDLYTGVNTSPTATDALGSATDIYETGADITPTETGGLVYTITLNTPFTFTNTTGGSLGLELSIFNTNFSFSTVTNQYFRLGGTGPNAGTAATYVWNDANDDDTFAGSEQTMFGNTRAGQYVSIIGTAAAAPEPATTSLCLLGAGAFGCALLRRRRQTIGA